MQFFFDSKEHPSGEPNIFYMIRDMEDKGL